MFKNLKIGTKIRAGFLIVAVLAGAMGVYSIVSLQGQGQNNVSQSDMILIGFVAAIVVVAVLLGIFLSRSISKPIENMMDAAKKLASGNSDIVLNINSKDEFGTLAAAFSSVVTAIHKLIKDAKMLTQNAVEGNLSSRADALQHEGDYRIIIEGVNATLDAIEQPMAMIENQIELLAAGKSSELVDESLYNGDFKRAAQNINTLRQALRGLIEDLVKMTQAASQGDLKFRADSSKQQGGFAQIIDGFNQTLDSVIDPIRESALALEEVAKGNLNVSVTGDYKGDHAILKDAVNETIASLKGYISEISWILSEMSKGNLTVEIASAYKGDFILLKDSLNDIISTLNELMLDIHSAAQQVSAGSDQVSQGNQAISQGATEQASSIEELTASITEIAEQTNRNAENASKSNEVVLAAKKAALDGNDQMKEMLHSMDGINESSENISKIIKVIDDIAFQTNILALNAAVEAARAGVHGKGFAVVAEEVRNLAARSANAAKETTELIEGSIKKVAEGTKIAQSTATALEKIVSGVEKTVELGEGIATASKEQAANIMQVNAGIEQMSQVVQTNSATAQEGAAASEELSGQALLLEEKLQQFRLKTSAAGSTPAKPQTKKASPASEGDGLNKY